VNGTFGTASENLTVTFDNVDLASIDALMLRPPQFSGRLTASAAVSGSRQSPS